MQLPLLKCIGFLNKLGCTQNPLLFKSRHKLLHEILRILEPAGNKHIQKEKKHHTYISTFPCKIDPIIFFCDFWKCNKMHKLCFLRFFYLVLQKQKWWCSSQLHTWNYLTLCAITWQQLVPQLLSPLKMGLCPIPLCTTGAEFEERFTAWE